VAQRLVLYTVAAGACVALTGCGGAQSTTAPPRTAAPATSASLPLTATTTKPPPAPPKPRRRPKPRPRLDPGALPQTEQLPSAATAGFHAEMAALWNGIRTNSVNAALRAFFPERAYAQVKRIADPQGDWADRLVGEYALDIGAAHALLGSDPAGAELLDVQVPRSYAHWVPPGACYNSVGYYEVPGARVVYRQDGELRSFGIASMISWRGVWYVVHLGAIVRSTAGGVVDDPSSGTGESAPSSTC
jgi:hypothetical protein